MRIVAVVTSQYKPDACTIPRREGRPFQLVFHFDRMIHPPFHIDLSQRPDKHGLGAQ
jgi:hypothetical protein